MTPKDVRSRRLKLGLRIEELARELRMPVERLRGIEGGDIALDDGVLLESTFERLERSRDS